MKKTPFYKNPSYYGCVDKTMDKKRLKRFEKQFQKRGFDDTVTWNLYFHIAEFIVPRLKAFKELNAGTPYCEKKDDFLTLEEWNEKIDKIIRAFELIVVADELIYTREQHEEMEEGFELFIKFFRSLWI